MKKIMLALMGAFACLSGNAQPFFTPPIHPPLIMPPATSMDVYGNVKTSSYGYDNVSFQVSSTVWQPQNLHVYSWNAANEMPGGIAWIRRNPTTNAIIDTGYISLPGNEYCRSVGIVQNNSATPNTYVIVAYYQSGTPANGFYYKTYQWTHQV